MMRNVELSVMSYMYWEEKAGREVLFLYDVLKRATDSRALIALSMASIPETEGHYRSQVYS